MKHTSFLVLGSNMGQRDKYLASAILFLRQNSVSIITTSAIYETEAWGGVAQNRFLNQAVQISSSHSPEELLHLCKKCEMEVGRLHYKHWADREIDIDIVFYNQSVINKKELIIPHPQTANRKFVLMPMNEIAPGFIHPVINMPISQLLNLCSDTLVVKKWN